MHYVSISFLIGDCMTLHWSEKCEECTNPRRAVTSITFHQDGADDWTTLLCGIHARMALDAANEFGWTVVSKVPVTPRTSVHLPREDFIP